MDATLLVKLPSSPVSKKGVCDFPSQDRRPTWIYWFYKYNITPVWLNALAEFVENASVRDMAAPIALPIDIPKNQSQQVLIPNIAPLYLRRSYTSVQ